MFCWMFCQPHTKTTFFGCSAECSPNRMFDTLCFLMVCRMFCLMFCQRNFENNVLFLIFAYFSVKFFVSRALKTAFVGCSAEWSAEWHASRSLDILCVSIFYDQCSAECSAIRVFNTVFFEVFAQWSAQCSAKCRLLISLPNSRTSLMYSRFLFIE